MPFTNIRGSFQGVSSSHWELRFHSKFTLSTSQCGVICQLWKKKTGRTPPDWAEADLSRIFHHLDIQPSCGHCTFEISGYDPLPENVSKACIGRRSEFVHSQVDAGNRIIKTLKAVRIWAHGKRHCCNVSCNGAFHSSHVGKSFSNVLSSSGFGLKVAVFLTRFKCFSTTLPRFFCHGLFETNLITVWAVEEA